MVMMDGQVIYFLSLLLFSHSSSFRFCANEKWLDIWDDEIKGDALEMREERPKSEKDEKKDDNKSSNINKIYVLYTTVNTLYGF